MAKRKKKQPEILHDKQGPFYYQTCFVRGKQKREKVRGFVVDGDRLVDSDEFIRNNASDIDLFEMGEYELLHERQEDRDS